MIAKVDQTPQKALGDLELKNQESALKARKKAPAPAASDAPPEEPTVESAGPVHIRYLGRNLDIIA